MSPEWFGGLSVAALAAWVYARHAERWWVEVTRRDLPIARLPHSLSGLTIAHLTDLHHGRFGPLRYIRRAVERTNALAPDVVALTGDFVDYRPEEVEPVARELGRLRAPLGVWAVLGGHDVRASERLFRRYFAEEGIRLLRNEAAPLPVEGQAVWIAGVRDNSEYFQHRLSQALAGVPRHAAVILLAHSPDIAWQAAERGVQLVLSGHTHGGQVCVPLFGPVVTESRYGRRFARGLTRAGETWIYTSRGVGVVRLPVRFFARPEIALHRLVSAPSPADGAVDESRHLVAGRHPEEDGCAAGGTRH
ncbi:MAG: metallophosphoesterase [Armatimonadota bacterium]|nr:metallophosphoesterase [Armatimonadota bacterium]